MRGRGTNFRLAVFSDIHGNWPALETVLEDIKRQGGADVLVAAGDLLTEGPFPQETYEVMRENEVQLLLGNHDEYLMDRGYENLSHRLDDPSPKIRASNAWTLERLNPEVMPYLANQPHNWRFGPMGPLTAPGPNPAQELLVTHATPRSCHDRVLSPEGTYQTDPHYRESYGHEKAGLVVFGHFHQSYTLKMTDGRRLVNVASVSMPWDKAHLAAYSLFEWDERQNTWQVTQRRVNYDWDRTARAMHTCSMPEKDFMLSYFV